MSAFLSVRSFEAKEDMMRNNKFNRIGCYAFVVFLGFAFSLPLHADVSGTIRGRIFDPLGAVIPGAEVILIHNGIVFATTDSDHEGAFVFPPVPAGRYQVAGKARGFSEQHSSPMFLPTGGTIRVDILLQIGTLQQQLVISATATELPQSQVGASVSVINREDLESLEKLDLLESLRLLAGAQVVQTGQRGGTTSLFVRGGDSNFNKVLIDGIPANDIGGAYEFANLSASAVDRLEILRGPNSVLYGTDALGSVVNIMSRRGISTVPEFTYAMDGGNFHSFRQEASLGGAVRRFDYFSAFSRFDTQNSLPNSFFHNGTYAGNFGLTGNEATGVRLTLRRTAIALGLPNALDFFGVADDSSQKEQTTDFGLAAEHQTTAHWHNLLRFALSRRQYQFVNPSPTGIPFDPFGYGPNYLGNEVTIRGANGFTASGRAILDYGDDYPQFFNATTTRQSVYAQSDYGFLAGLSGSLGFRYEKERGFTESGSGRSSTDRDNFSYFLEVHGSAWRRIYATAGLGLEDNAVFGFAATPRVSLAYYLRRPSSDAFIGDTKLKFNFGKGIKEPSISEEGSSLFKLLAGIPQGPALISRFGISPIGPERSRSFDWGVEQGLWSGRARFGITFFHNRFFDLIEFVPKSVLPQLGVPLEAAAATAFGARINSSSFRALGIETEIEIRLARGLHFRAEHTYLDAAVTESFASSALQPAFNPAFPGIPIGAFSPLVGNRPFNRSPHSGSVRIDYSQRNLGFSLSGYFVSRQDSSTFLSDGFFGNSLLLPNRNLGAGYQKIDFSGKYVLNAVISFYFSVENILSQHYRQAIGYAALPLAFRAGVRFTIGGQRWK